MSRLFRLALLLGLAAGWLGAADAAADLAAARSELMQLQGRYGENHPKVVDQQLRVTVLQKLVKALMIKGNLLLKCR